MKKLPSMVRALAEKDAFAASRLAARGKVYNDAEEMTWLYLRGLKSLAEAGAEQRKLEEPYVAQSEQTIFDFVIKAIRERNHVPLFELAEAVLTIRKQGLNIPYVDPIRAHLLTLKGICQQRKIKYTRTHLAMLVGFNGNMDWFRREVIALGVPFRKESGGRKRRLVERKKV